MELIVVVVTSVGTAMGVGAMTASRKLVIVEMTDTCWTNSSTTTCSARSYLHAHFCIPKTYVKCLLFRNVGRFSSLRMGL